MLTDRLASERDTMFAQLKTEMIEIEDQLQRTNTIDLDDLSDEFEQPARETIQVQTMPSSLEIS
jgi:hypothetical protein